jgi:hypothetical protein
MGFFGRIAGVLVAPRATYQAVVARPRALGVLLLGMMLVAGATFAFLSTEVGQEALLDQQYAALQRMESLGLRMPPEAYNQLDATAARAPYFSAASQMVGIPLAAAAIAGLLIMVFNFVLGGDATFRQVFAVVSHAGLIFAVGALFAMPLNYAKGSLASRANLALLAPFLPDTSFPARMLGVIDLFWVWWLVNLAIGLGVLYKRKTGPIATSFLVIYAVVAVGWAAVATFAGA